MNKFLNYFFKKIPNLIINKYTFHKQKVEYSPDLKVYGKIKIYNRGGSISIGKNTIINSGMQYNPVGFDEQMNIFVASGASVVIGNNVGISNSAFCAKKEIVIEDDVRIGNGCKVYDTDFHSLDYAVRMDPERDGKEALCKPVLIRTGAFIGAGSIILKGVTIGRHSVIGAGSVVTGNVPDGEIWAGNPAGFIRKVEAVDR